MYSRPSELLDDTDRLSLAQYLELWLTHMRTRVRASTYDGYAGLVRCHVIPSLGSVRLSELHPLQIQGLYADRMVRGCRGRSEGLSNRTIVHLHRVLVEALGQAVRWRILTSNPALDAQPPRPSAPSLAVVDPELARRIRSMAVGTRFEIPVAVALGTGMRRGEILALRWLDIDFERGSVRVCRTLQHTSRGISIEEPKTAKSRRIVALPDFLVQLLGKQRDLRRHAQATRGHDWKEADFIMEAKQGQPWDPDIFSASWPRFLRKVGLPHVRFHDLRHAHATIMLVKGVHPKIVSERLGHANIGITLDTYSHVLPSMQAEAAKAIDEVFSPSA